MTRARDLLIFARGGKESEGSWIKTIEADWLSSKDSDTELLMPNGETIAHRYEILQPIDYIDNNKSASGLYWFKQPDQCAAALKRLPLKFSPSSALQQVCKVTENVVIGNRMTLQSGTDMAELGTAIHGCIGASFTNPDLPLSVTEIATVLARMNVANAIQPEQLQAQIAAFQTWINARWPEAIAYAEISTVMQLSNGQVLQGRIDLLLKVNGGWILIDHKSNPSGADCWDAIAQEYAGQLDAYKKAVEQASGEKVLESWLFMPVAAALINVE